MNLVCLEIELIPTKMDPLPLQNRNALNDLPFPSPLLKKKNKFSIQDAKGVHIN